MTSRNRRLEQQERLALERAMKQARLLDREFRHKPVKPIALTSGEVIAVDFGEDPWTEGGPTPLRFNRNPITGSIDRKLPTWVIDNGMIHLSLVMGGEIGVRSIIVSVMSPQHPLESLHDAILLEPRQLTPIGGWRSA